MGRGLTGELLPRVVVKGSGVRVVVELIRSFMMKMSYGRETMMMITFLSAKLTHCVILRPD